MLLFRVFSARVLLYCFKFFYFAQGRAFWILKSWNVKQRENRNGKGNHRGNQWKMTVTTTPQMLSTCRYCHSIHSILLSTKEPKEPSFPISIQFIVFTRSHSPGQPSRQQSAFNIPFQSHFVHQPNSTETKRKRKEQKSRHRLKLKKFSWTTAGDRRRRRRAEAWHPREKLSSTVHTEPDGPSGNIQIHTKKEEERKELPTKVTKEL